MEITTLEVPVPALGGDGLWGSNLLCRWKANVSEVGGVSPYSLLEELGHFCYGRAESVEIHSPTLQNTRTRRQ